MPEEIIQIAIDPSDEKYDGLIFALSNRSGLWISKLDADGPLKWEKTNLPDFN